RLAVPSGHHQHFQILLSNISHAGLKRIRTIRQPTSKYLEPFKDAERSRGELDQTMIYTRCTRPFATSPSESTRFTLFPHPSALPTAVGVPLRSFPLRHQALTEF